MPDAYQRVNSGREGVGATLLLKDVRHHSQVKAEGESLQPHRVGRRQIGFQPHVRESGMLNPRSQVVSHNAETL